MKARCYSCGKGMVEGVTLIRQNAKGQPAIWACDQHNENQDQDLLITVAELERLDRGECQ